MKIFLVYEMGRGLGHVTRLARLAIKLDEAGHEVVVFGNDIATLTLALQGTGIIAHATPPLPQSVRLYPAQNYAGVIRYSGFQSPTTLVGMRTSWAKMFDIHQPDIVICEHAPTVLLAAINAGIKTHHIGTGFIVPPLIVEADVRPWVQNKPVSDDWAHVDRVIKQATNVMGGRRLDSLISMLATPKRWLFTWPELDHYERRFDERYHGPILSISEKLSGINRTSLLVYIPRSTKVAETVMSIVINTEISTTWIVPEISRPERYRNILFIPKVDCIDSLVGNDTVCIYRAGHGLSADIVRIGAKAIFVTDSVESTALAFRLQTTGLGNILPVAADMKSMVEGVMRIHNTDHNGATRLAIRRKYSSFQSSVPVDSFVLSM